MKSYEIHIVKSDNFTGYTPQVLRDGYEIKVNELELAADKGDYIIKDNSIIFNNALTIGDKVIITNSILNNTKVVTKSNYDQTALVRLSSPMTKFKYNHKYKFDLVSKEEQDYSLSFFTQFQPFFSNIKTIRTDTGNLLDSTDDEAIAFLIYKNSKVALESLGEDVEDIPTYAKNYVRYQTDLDLCQAFYITISGLYGDRSKTVGDIKIETSVKLPDVKDMMLRFKELLKPLEDLMNGDKITVTSLVESEKNTYPVSDRGIF